MRYLILLLILLLVTGCVLPPVATGTIPPIPSAPITSNNELISYQGRYRIAVPREAIVYQNQNPSVDGILAPLENTVTFQTEEYIFSLTHYVLAAGTTVDQFVDEISQCMMVSSENALPLTLGEIAYQAFPDTPCGPSGISFFYTVVDGRGYRISVEANSPYQTIAEEIEAILASFVLNSMAIAQDAAQQDNRSATTTTQSATTTNACQLPTPVQLVIDRNPNATLDEMTEAIQVGWMVLSTIHQVAIVPVSGGETLGEPVLFVQWNTPAQNERGLSVLWRVDGRWQQQTVCNAKQR